MSYSPFQRVIVLKFFFVQVILRISSEMIIQEFLKRDFRDMWPVFVIEKNDVI